VYALVVLGHTHHVNVRTAGHSPRVVRPNVHDLLPETDGTQFADMMRTLGTVVALFAVVRIVFGRTLSNLFASLFSVKRSCGDRLLDRSRETAVFECRVLWLNTVLRKVWTLWNCLSVWCVLMSDIITFRFVCLS